MIITRIDTHPLRIPYKTPFHWAQGVIEAAEVILISVHTDEGITGYGESMSSACANSVEAQLGEVRSLLMGKNPLCINALMQQAFQHLFAARGNCSAPRFGALVLAGLDMALWDIAGKACGRPVYELLGGPLHEHIRYFGFPQGDTAEELARDARAWAEHGNEVIYVKVGRGEALDLAIAREVRGAIGSRRLRLDANEAWDTLTAMRMIRALAAYDIELIEQPTSSTSLAALAQVKASSPIAVAADQLVFSPEDVFDVCRERAADLIVLGLHETGTLQRFLKAAAIAEAAGLRVCLHGLYETGITTCAMHQAGAVIANLDDGNQFMNHLLVEDILESPTLTLKDGRLPLLTGQGLGFTLDWDAIGRAQEAHRRSIA